MKDRNDCKTQCDMCGSDILEGRCDCGTWEQNTENHPYRKALEEFDKIKQMTLTADAPHLGCALILFRGDYNDCKEVENFIYKLKGRPYY